MAKVTGIGGVFFKAQDPEKMRIWYREHLGIDATPEGGAVFEWREAGDSNRRGMTVWAVFPQDTRYFDPSRAPFMVNYRVTNLRETLAELRAKGVPVDERVEESEFGRFGWITDPEGNRIELWEPPRDGS
jgi:predicted enzyme related to lactoylglutathione lyase